MIIFIVTLGTSLLTGLIVWKLKRSETIVRFEEREPEKTNITFEDILRLVNTNDVADISVLMAQYEVNLHMPEFYEQFQMHHKRSREAFYNELIDILGRGRKDSVQGIYNNYPAFSIQDVLLLLMCERQLDNKTMARVMGSNVDTLKKRKTRLKNKMIASGLEITFEKKKDAQSCRQPDQE